MKTLSLVALAATAVAGMGATATFAASPTIYLDSSNVIATGSNIYLNRLPILLPNGTIIYKDVTIQLNSDFDRSCQRRLADRAGYIAQLAECQLQGGHLFVACQHQFRVCYERPGSGLRERHDEVGDQCDAHKEPVLWDTGNFLRRASQRPPVRCPAESRRNYEY